jgi:hypothetical protein
LIEKSEQPIYLLLGRKDGMPEGTKGTSLFCHSEIEINPEGYRRRVVPTILIELDLLQR